MRTSLARRFRLHVQAVVVIALLILGPLGNASAESSPASQAAAPPSETLGAHATHLSLRAPSASPRLDARLESIASVAEQSGSPAAVSLARASALGTLDTRVRVVVQSSNTSDNRSATRAAVVAAGGKVEGEYADLVQALVPFAGLRTLSASPAVLRVRPPAQPYQASTADEGVHTSGDDVWQTGGFTGAGVRVAIIDEGFAGLAGLQASGDLPASVQTQDFCEGGFATATQHGAAVASIVYKMAPGVQLYLICVGTEVDLGLAEQYAVVHGVQIVNHSVSWFNTSAGNGTGSPGSPNAIAADARANGILWVNSAGNSAETHWSGTFVDGDGDGLLNFAPNNNGNAVAVPSGGQVCMLLKWNDWPISHQDYDLFLVRASDSAFVASSTNNQTIGAPPTEALCYTNPSAAPAVFFAVIANFQTTATPQLDLFVNGGSNIQYPVAAGSVTEPASSPQTLAVGATCWQTDVLEPFSSQGPTIDGRTKPDLAGPDSTSSAVYGAFGGCGTTGFAGTSAAAPHVAGAAALVKQANPNFGPGQIQALLAGRATDLGTPGIDNQTGAGELALGTPATSGGGSLVTTLTAPVRLMDTRTLGGAIGTGQSRCFSVAGLNGIPADAAAVLLNVTAVGYGTPGWLTVYPSGQAVPATSTLNFDTTEYAMANGTIMRIGSSGQVCVNVGTVNSVTGGSHVVLDATGFLSSSALAQLPMLASPQRVADTRIVGGAIPTSQSRCFTVAGAAGVPGDAAAVVLNVTAVGYGTKGWLTAYPNGQPVPATSTLNFDTSEYAVANGSIMRIGSGGQVCVNVGTVNSAPGSSQVVLDVTGYLTTAGLAQLPMLAAPQRLVDTRTTSGPIASGQSRCFLTAGQMGIPANVTAVVVNVTAVGYGTQGWLTAYPSGQLVPATSTLNFDTSEYAMANGAIIAVGSGGQVCVNVGTVNSAPGSAQVILDVVGYLP